MSISSQNTVSNATIHLVRILLFIVSAWSCPCYAERVPPPIPATIAEQLSLGKAQDIIVLYDDRDVEAEAVSLRERGRKAYDDDSILAFRRSRYRSIKQVITAGFSPGEVEEIQDYDHLPMSLVRFKSLLVLKSFLADTRVQAIYEDRPVYSHITNSLPFIGQPVVANAGFTGYGQTVAVIDTGIDYTLATFGSCTVPGSPTGCRIAASVDVTGHGVTLNKTANNHGTNVAGIVAGVAPGARVAAINAFYNNSSSTNWVIAAVNWAIANKSVYNIGTLNMSLGDGSNYTSLCGDSQTNPFMTPLTNARTAGIIPVASSGNNAFTNGMTSPACTPGIVSVGAVYDANWGGPYTWSTSGCTDPTVSAPDMIPCFSNSASFLTILAPGAYITAAGIQLGGTSQAAPHVAGALAVLHAAFSSESLDQTVARLTTTGVPITDNRNSITIPRLNLPDAISPPANDMFANRVHLVGNTGQIMVNNLNATKETEEPNHAGNAGGRSVWWRWVPAVSGVVSFDTHGSNFNTVLAVYGGTTLSGLSQVAANDNDGSTGNTSGVAFTALAGKEYLIAVDGYNGATGTISLNWSLVQQANLVSVTVSGTGTVNSSSTTTGIPNDITCNSGICSAGYPSNSMVDLTATPPWYSTVGWSGCAASGNNCSLVMDADKNVSLTFSKNQNVMVSANPYSTIQEAYSFCNPSGTILARDSSKVTFLENLDFNKDFTITLNGGMDVSFQPVVGFTVIKGSMKISAGKVIVNKILLQY